MATERARQKRLERKRRKREERRRALRAEPDWVEFSPPPMSLLLKTFAEPLLDRLPDRTNPDDWRLVLSWAALVWNAFTDGEAVSERALDLGRQLFKSFGWEEDVTEEVALLRARRERFHWERRKVARVHVEDRGDMMHVVALSMLT